MAFCIPFQTLTPPLNVHSYIIRNSASKSPPPATLFAKSSFSILNLIHFPISFSLLSHHYFTNPDNPFKLSFLFIIQFPFLNLHFFRNLNPLLNLHSKLQTGRSKDISKGGVDMFMSELWAVV